MSPYAYPDDPAYRTLRDPDDPIYILRCYDLQLQFKCVDTGMMVPGAWYPLTSKAVRLCNPSAARQAAWADLFVRPLVDSPELP